MALRRQGDSSGDELAGGFATVDDKGRFSISKSLRNALGIRPGSSVAYIPVGNGFLVIPQDEHLLDLMEQARLALSARGDSVQDLLDELPRARAEIVNETYGPAFVAELQRAWNKAHGLDEDESAK